MLAWVRPALLIAATLAASGSASADWQVSRGQGATFLSEEVGYTRLLFVCAGGNLGFGVGSDVLGPLPEEEDDKSFLSIQIDGGLRYEAPSAYRRNENGGFDVTFTMVEELPAIIGEVIAAKSTIQVGLMHGLFGQEFRWTAGATGSTKAGKEFAKTCGIGPQTKIATDTPNWQTKVVQQDASTGVQLAVLIGSLQRGGQLYASCDTNGSALLGLLASDLPYEIGDVGLSMIVEIDGQDRTAVGEYFEGSDGQKGVKYTGDYVASVVREILSAGTTVKMAVKDYSDGSILEWPAVGLSGLSAAGATFDAACGGGTKVEVEVPAVEATPPADPVTSLTADVASAAERSNQGDYVGAFASLRPLAMRGHPDLPLEWDAEARAAFVIVADKLSDQLFSNSASDKETTKHEADFVLAFEIASLYAEGDVFENWGMRYYLGKMYLDGRGVAQDEDTGVAWLQRVVDSGDTQYSARAKDILCVNLVMFEFC